MLLAASRPPVRLDRLDSEYQQEGDGMGDWIFPWATPPIIRPHVSQGIFTRPSSPRLSRGDRKEPFLRYRFDGTAAEADSFFPRNSKFMLRDISKMIRASGGIWVMKRSVSSPRTEVADIPTTTAMKRMKTDFLIFFSPFSIGLSGRF